MDLRQKSYSNELTPDAPTIGKLKDHSGFPEWQRGLFKYAALNPDVFFLLKNKVESPIEETMTQTFYADHERSQAKADEMYEKIAGKKASTESGTGLHLCWN